jgi:hypothetical protein
VFRRRERLCGHDASCVNTKEIIVSPKGKLFMALAVAALAVPALASAQQAYGPPPESPSYGPPAYDQPPPGYGQPDAGPQGYGQPGPGPQGYGADQGPGPDGQAMQGGPRQGHHAQLGVYPQFRSLEKHIKRTVRQERRANALQPRDAHGLMAQLRQIQSEEMSAYQTHGMNLPANIQARIQGELTQLAQAVDARQGQGYQGQGYQGQGYQGPQ